MVKRDGVIEHTSKHENGNWMKNIALLRDRSIWYPAWSGKLGIKLDFMKFWAWFTQKTLRETRKQFGDDSHLDFFYTLFV